MIQPPISISTTSSSLGRWSPSSCLVPLHLLPPFSPFSVQQPAQPCDRANQTMSLPLKFPVAFHCAHVAWEAVHGLALAFFCLILPLSLIALASSCSLDTPSPFPLQSICISCSCCLEGCCRELCNFTPTLYSSLCSSILPDRPI